MFLRGKLHFLPLLMGLWLVLLVCFQLFLDSTAVQIHAKLTMALDKRTVSKSSLPAQVGKGGNASSRCGIALVPAC